MRRGFLRAAVVFGVGMTMFAMAEAPSVHDVPWYKEHPAARKMMLSACHRDAAKQRSTDCENAKAASAADMQAANRKLFAYMYEPQYWHDNPFARDVVIGHCDHPSGTNDMMLPFCDAARRGR